MFSNPHHLLTPANYPRFRTRHAITGLKTRKQGVSRPFAPLQPPSRRPIRCLYIGLYRAWLGFDRFQRSEGRISSIAILHVRWSAMGEYSLPVRTASV